MSCENIMFVIGYMGNGGAERVISVLANDFANKGHNVSIVTILGDKIDYELDQKINYLPLESKYRNKVFRVIERLLFIRKNIKLTKSKYIVSFLAQINIYTIIASMFTSSKLVVSERNDPYQDPNSKAIRKIRDILYRLPNGFVFQTPDAKEYFSEKIQDKSTVIPNPLKNNLPEAFCGERKKVIVTAVRLDEQKNIPMLIDAFYKINKKYNDYELKIFGEGPLRDKLCKYVSELNISDKVSFCGYSQNLHKAILDASMFVLTSNYEGISNSMIEALALGIPVISTDHPIGGARMFIESGQNGFLVPVNDVKELTSAMLSIIENEELSNKFSNNAVDIKNKLDSKKISNKWEQFIVN